MIDDSSEKNLENEPDEARRNIAAESELPEISRETTPEEQIESRREREMPGVEEARRKFEKFPEAERELTAEEKKEAKEERINIAKLDPQGKIDRLLYLAREKGLFFAVRIARDSDDPYILDSLHDILAKDENYKKLL